MDREMFGHFLRYVCEFSTFPSQLASLVRFLFDRAAEVARRGPVAIEDTAWIIDTTAVYVSVRIKRLPIKHQALLYNIIPPTTAIIDYAVARSQKTVS